MTGPRNVRRKCTRCGLDCSVTESGHTRAHLCPHGSQCVVPYERRRTGEKPAHCGVCAGGALDRRLQLPFPFKTGLR